MDNSLTLEGLGKILDPLNSSEETHRQMAEMVELATDDLSLNKVRGGWMYIYCPPGLESMDISSSFLISVYVSALVINQVIHLYTLEEMVEKLKGCRLLEDCPVEDYLQGYGNRCMLLKTPTEILRMPFNNKYKFLFISEQLFHTTSDPALLQHNS